MTSTDDAASKPLADGVIRVAAATAVLAVAGIAAVISYRHAYELVRSHGESGATAAALPLTVDGLIVTCSLVILDAARRREPAPKLAWWLLAAGVVATLGANVAHGWSHGLIGIAVAGWPALVAVGSFEMLARLIRGRTVLPVRARKPRTATPPKQVTSTAGKPAQVRPRTAEDESDGYRAAVEECKAALRNKRKMPGQKTLGKRHKISHRYGGYAQEQAQQELAVASNGHGGAQ